MWIHTKLYPVINTSPLNTAVVSAVHVFHIFRYRLVRNGKVTQSVFYHMSEKALIGLNLDPQTSPGLIHGCWAVGPWWRCSGLFFLHVVTSTNEMVVFSTELTWSRKSVQWDHRTSENKSTPVRWADTWDNWGNIRFLGGFERFNQILKKNMYIKESLTRLDLSHVEYLNLNLC